ncbi:MAG: VTC domain-containing protein [Bacteroidota bacterium]
MRYERKYRVEELGLAGVRAILERHPVSFRTLYPDRQVNNIYLDTRQMTFYRENLSGVSQRRKYRIRWYGPDLLQVRRPVLEIKLKDGELGEKVSAGLPDFAVGRYPDVQQALRSELRALAYAAPETDAAPERVEADAEGESAVVVPKRRPFPVLDLVPALLNTYRRSYLISNDGRFRLTIDREMHFYRMGAGFRPYRNYAEDRVVVVEVKYEAADDPLYYTVGQYLPFRLGKNSKYVNGMRFVGNV